MNFQLEKQIHFGYYQAGKYTSSAAAHKITKMKKKAILKVMVWKRPAKSLNIYYNAG